jgi:hypothetical protein
MRIGGPSNIDFISKGIKMKKLTILVWILVLTGCAGGDWYKAQDTASVAKLRVAAIAESNTEFASKAHPSCDTEEWHILGWFHPSAGSMQAGRRGFDRRVGIPLGNEYPDNMYAEHIIEAQKPINLFVSGTYHKGPTIYSSGNCRKMATFTPKPNHDYEVLFVGNGPECEVKLFEIAISSGGETQRIESSFENGVRSCK